MVTVPKMISLASRIAIFSVILANTHAALLKDSSGRVHLEYDVVDDGLDIILKRDNEIKVTGKLLKGKNLKHLTCLGQESCSLNDVEHFSIKALENGFNISWVSKDPLRVAENCFQLNSNTTNWYGGPERYNQSWPLEKMQISNEEPYIIKKTDNFAVAERYWLSSQGFFIYLDEKVPLWVDQNHNYDDTVCFKAEAVDPYVNRNESVLSYAVMVYDNAKEAHLKAVNNYLGKPTGHPNDKMIAEPIWTTWAKYKKPITDAIVLTFAQDIRNHGYDGGQLEIDDDWEVCYGAQTFKHDMFGNISNTVKSLKDDNWRVTLWVHPFVDDTCQNNSNYGKEHDYFAKNISGQTLAIWWNSDNSHQIDFTNSEAAQWWVDRVKKLQENPGIDSFKFDAGESNFVNQPPDFKDVYLAPNILTTKYIETCNQFGSLIEVRSAYRTQKHPHFVRMQDKDSTWGLDNGLASLITTLLQMNMNGYGMVLPDMIGGNGYNGNVPTGELIVRWTQANAFMPSMQFSYLPWDYDTQVDFDIEGIVKEYVQMHAEYSPRIIAAMNQSIENGTPVNPPIWWLDPTDQVALGISDEYLLGEEILVAPVIEEGAISRDVYLPTGQWKDGNTGTVIQGPTTLKNYSAPIKVLPWFIKV